MLDLHVDIPLQCVPAKIPEITLENPMLIAYAVGSQKTNSCYSKHYKYEVTVIAVIQKCRMCELTLTDQT